MEKELETFKGKRERLKVSHTYLTLEARENKDTLLGVESSGHMVFPECFLFDDAMVIPLTLGFLIAQREEKLSTLLQKIPKLPKGRRTIDVPDEKKFDVIRHLEAQLSSQGLSVNPIDGVRIDYDDGWVLCRASNTSPLVRIIAEADTDSKCTTYLEEYSKLIQEILKE